MRESRINGFSPAAARSGIVAIEQPLARLDRDLLVAHGGRHVDAVRDAVRVGNDDARSVVGFRFEERLERVLVFRAHGDAGDVNIAVAHGHQPEIFLRARLAAGGELRDCSAGRGLRGLAAGIGVNLGIEHEQVHIAAAGDHMVEAAVADVVRPAITADDPDALLDQHVGESQQLLGFGRFKPLQFFFQQFDALPLLENVGFVFLCRGDQGGGEFVSD